MKKLTTTRGDTLSVVPDLSDKTVLVRIHPNASGRGGFAWLNEQGIKALRKKLKKALRKINPGASA